MPAGRRKEVHARLVASTSFETWFWLNQQGELSNKATRKVMIRMVEDALE